MESKVLQRFIVLLGRLNPLRETEETFVFLLIASRSKTGRSQVQITPLRLNLVKTLEFFFRGCGVP